MMGWVVLPLYLREATTWQQAAAACRRWTSFSPAVSINTYSLEIATDMQ
jgi:hypothetical protein